jgi:hypothetical protein
MDKDKLTKINKALKIGVNLAKPGEAGYDALLEAKDIVEREIKLLETERPRPRTSSCKFSNGRSFSECHIRFGAAQMLRWCAPCKFATFGPDISDLFGNRR